MKVYKHLSEFNPIKNAVVTTGTFDGVHIGHQKIIHRVKEIAHQIAGESVIITFHPHPRLVLFPEDNHLKMLNTLPEKIKLLAASGIDHLIIIPFTKEFSRLSSVDFIQQILVDQIGTKKLVIGYDHHFGKNREGSFEHLKHYGPSYGFEVEEIPKQDVNDIGVSSTKIRTALAQHQIEIANQYLGYPYAMEGIVVKGDQIGRSIGFPTANIQIQESHKLIPADGIYAVHIQWQSQTYKGMLYIGDRPTVQGSKKVIEVNIFDFDKEIYDEQIQVKLIQYIRGDQKFDSLDVLKLGIQQDEINCRKALS
jgi:riboflavin kinase/FMN adenylyltransferase